MNKDKNGFTLIELLVVISIIALLLSVLTPSLNLAKERARRSLCTSNQRQLVLSAIMYANDYEGKFPLRSGFCAGPEYFALAKNLATRGSTPSADNIAQDDRHLFSGYVDGFVLEKRGVNSPGIDEAPEIMWCPSAQRSYMGYGKFSDEEGTWPDSGWRTDGWDGYWMGYLYFNLGTDSPWFTWNDRALKMPTRMQDPSYTPLFGDQMCLNRSTLPGSNVWRNATHFRSGAAEFIIVPPEKDPEGMNNALADGSVRWFNYTEDLKEPIWISGNPDYVYVWGQ